MINIYEVTIKSAHHTPWVFLCDGTKAAVFKFLAAAGCTLEDTEHYVQRFGLAMLRGVPVPVPGYEATVDVVNRKVWRCE